MFVMPRAAVRNEVIVTYKLDDYVLGYEPGAAPLVFLKRLTNPWDDATLKGEPWLTAAIPMENPYCSCASPVVVVVTHVSFVLRKGRSPARRSSGSGWTSSRTGTPAPRRCSRSGRR